MRPIVIYVGKSDEIKLTKEEFEKYLKEAYDSGYSEGYAAGNRYYYPFTNIPQTHPEPLKITWDYTGTPPEINLPHITCDGANDVSNYTIKSDGKATYDWTQGVLKHEET